MRFVAWGGGSECGSGVTPSPFPTPSWIVSDVANM